MTLHYPFPVIRHIDDILPHIAGKPEFIRVDKDGGYTVINYVFQSNDTFPPVTPDNPSAAILRECRGLVFYTDTGLIANRRFHKFFNCGEHPDITIDVSRHHGILDKLDGSMISPIKLKDGIRWISKMGITDVSMQAELFVVEHPEYTNFAKRCLDSGITPVFEWLSRQQRIVLDYGKDDQLVLLAMRNNIYGGYAFRSEVCQLGDLYNIPVVKEIRSNIRDDTRSFLSDLRQKENTEGVVITFDDGHMVKVKTDWYVQLHRAKDKISHERHIIALVLEDKVDDLLPVLPDEDRERVIEFSTAVNQDIQWFGEAVYDVMRMVRLEGWDRKSFAIRSENLYHPPVRNACFALFDTPIEEIQVEAALWGRKFVLRNLGSSSAVEKAKQVLQTANWNSRITTE